MADVISNNEVTSLTTQEKTVQENYYGSIGIITELQNSILNKSKDINAKQLELDGYRAQLVVAQTAINNMASGIVLGAGSYPWTATAYRAGSARDVCVISSYGMPNPGEINFSNLETTRTTITNVRNAAVGGKDIANSLPYFSWPEIKSASLGNGSSQSFGQYYDFTGIAALPEGRKVANRFLDDTIGYCDNLINLINSSVANITAARSQGEAALTPIINSINNAVGDLAGLNSVLNSLRIEITNKVAEYDAAMEEARAVASTQAAALVQRTLASDTEYQKALLLTQASTLQNTQNADIEKARLLAQIEADTSLQKDTIAADLEKARIEAAGLASASIAAADAAALALENESITSKPWFWPAIAGGVLLLAVGSYFAFKK